MVITCYLLSNPSPIKGSGDTALPHTISYIVTCGASPCALSQTKALLRQMDEATATSGTALVEAVAQAFLLPVMAGHKAKKWLHDNYPQRHVLHLIECLPAACVSQFPPDR